jgi:hypothetical protein
MMPRLIRSLTVSCSVAVLLTVGCPAFAQTDVMTPPPASASVGQLPVLAPPAASSTAAPLTPMPESV